MTLSPAQFPGWKKEQLPSGHTRLSRSCGHCGGSGSDPFESHGECLTCGGSGTEQRIGST